MYPFILPVNKIKILDNFPSHYMPSEPELGQCDELQRHMSPIMSARVEFHVRSREIRLGLAGRAGNEPLRSLKFYNHREGPTSAFTLKILIIVKTS